ncbi:uncharacterized protein L969DRAFT_83802 [Mixia osmundae IAM 14324]|uniref:UBL3-like ubiquitin domain-containing protein n=1 Tax=Mixia osmundae (strain CBS 9802 / IAM 14324 / JCM 22182 / KY 12970) TaxID=764103 RepID=G7E3T9_MIXOS|nr:uncharacterized protein L969DRAFT_83802 [Mixia osmundae IAM 14324]KEI41944.1 hypothetical protein L969DRAFT_83802 [Mixia osmundae IAM 14324]GAA97499.1 hypothetical protein E5Q_04177 [Mixia osmundae IAM 14324]
MTTQASTVVSPPQVLLSPPSPIPGTEEASSASATQILYPRDSVGSGQADLPAGTTAQPSMTTTLAAPSPASEGDHAGDVRVSFLLVSSGKKTPEYHFDAQTKVAQVIERLYTDWPGDLAADMPPDRSTIRLIHRGRFLNAGESLRDARLAPDAVTTLHLTVASNAQKSESTHIEKPRDKGLCSSCAIS